MAMMVDEQENATTALPTAELLIVIGLALTAAALSGSQAGTAVSLGVLLIAIDVGVAMWIDQSAVAKGQRRSLQWAVFMHMQRAFVLLAAVLIANHMGMPGFGAFAATVVFGYFTLLSARVWRLHTTETE
jgi:hypothetical protein